ncbi:hypothetical protein [Chryseobacterium indoltheticum]|uniref:hypothetical protein n=1 Tax=Chryseobacterium indoltheticum TaxID=254 RepID=UPI003F495B1C
MLFALADAAFLIAQEAFDDAEENGTPQELAQATQALADANSDKMIANSIVTLTTNNLTKITAANVDEAITNVYQLYNKALDQAELLKDRFVIMDVLGDEAVFRNKVISTGLKYGAVIIQN